jgi:hypothetical protein
MYNLLANLADALFYSIELDKRVAAQAPWNPLITTLDRIDSVDFIYTFVTNRNKTCWFAQRVVPK